MTICIGVLIITPNNHSKIIDTIERNSSLIKDVENIFSQVSRSQVPFSDIMEESFYAKMNQYDGPLKDLKTALSGIENDGLSLDHQDLYQLLFSQVTMWQDSITFYNQIYNAYHNSDLDFFKKLALDGNHDKSLIGERFAQFFEFDSYWVDQLNQNACNLENTSEECVTARAGYSSNLLSLLDSPQVSKTIFAVYDTSLYDEPSISSKINAAIKELK